MKFRIWYLLFIAILSPAALWSQDNSLLNTGNWRGELTLNDSTVLPFTFSVTYGFYKDQPVYGITVINAEERIIVEDCRVSADSVSWTMPVFATKFRCRRESTTSFSGEWNNTAASKPYILKFRATYNAPRILQKPACTKGMYDLNGRYECTFSDGLPDSSKAVGLFNHLEGGLYTGTFLTETGDYRYLEGGYIACDKILLSAFDGQHAFLFIARKVSLDSISGEAWYGKYGYEKWSGRHNEKFELRNPETLTWIKDSTSINFTFNDLNGKPVSLSDERFKGKVVILQIMGSWCPNCMDETAWLSEVYRKYNAQGLEIVALAYERPGDTATQNAAIRRVRNRFDAGYTFLNTGKSGRDSASASLPFLNGIMGFPTTIYIDRTGKVRRIFTGYNGPATGSFYYRDTEETLRLIQELLSE